MSRLEQRVVIRDLTLKNLSVAEIATELQSVYDADALKYSMVSKWRRRFQDVSDDLFDLARSDTPSRSDRAASIQSLLQQFPFISCKVLCLKLKIDEATCVCFTMIYIWKSSICARFRIHWKLIESRGGSNFPESFSRDSNKIKDMRLNIY
jgi:hypothetical protein